MSPEHARGETIDARADVFAAGIVLWELAAGRRMYKTTEGGFGLLDLARRANIPELPRNGLPGEREAARASSRRRSRPKRDARYPSAAAMQRDLDAYAASAKLMTSPLALGEWLKKTFGEEILARRRARERATEALEKGAPLVLAGHRRRLRNRLPRESAPSPRRRGSTAGLPCARRPRALSRCAADERGARGYVFRRSRPVRPAIEAPHDGDRVRRGRAHRG